MLEALDLNRIAGLCGSCRLWAKGLYIDHDKLNFVS